MLLKLNHLSCSFYSRGVFNLRVFYINFSYIFWELAGRDWHTYFFGYFVQSSFVESSTSGDIFIYLAVMSSGQTLCYIFVIHLFTHNIWVQVVILR